MVPACLPACLQNRKLAESSKFQLFNEAVQRLEKGLEVGRAIVLHPWTACMRCCGRSMRDVYPCSSLSPLMSL